MLVPVVNRRHTGFQLEQPGKMLLVFKSKFISYGINGLVGIKNFPFGFIN